MNSVAMLGCGSWGLTLARLLQRKGASVAAWEFDPVVAAQLRQTRELKNKLPGVIIPEEIDIDSDLSKVVRGKDVIVMAVPSSFIRNTSRSVKEAVEIKDQIFVSVAKGLERETLKTMTEVIEDELQLNEPDRIVALSGPSHAEEVSRDLPTTVVVAGRSMEIAAKVQDLFMTDLFRTYTSDDLKGVEIAAALKNVIAIAAGISDGLGFGDNGKAALISRGLWEILRIGVEMGAKASTFSGLAGLGDLVATCTSEHSRNRKFGELIAQKVPDAQEKIGMVVEGLETARSMMILQEKYRVELPISTEVYRVLFEGKSPEEAVGDLMQRQAKPEMEAELYK